MFPVNLFVNLVVMNIFGQNSRKLLEHLRSPHGGLSDKKEWVITSLALHGFEVMMLHQLCMANRKEVEHIEQIVTSKYLVHHLENAVRMLTFTNIGDESGEMLLEEYYDHIMLSSLLNFCTSLIISLLASVNFDENVSNEGKDDSFTEINLKEGIRSFFAFTSAILESEKSSRKDRDVVLVGMYNFLQLVDVLAAADDMSRKSMVEGSDLYRRNTNEVYLKHLRNIWNELDKSCNHNKLNSQSKKRLRSIQHLGESASVFSTITYQWLQDFLNHDSIALNGMNNFCRGRTRT